jgi:protein-tyrosine phosphatase/membrane-associated phospholipid phosphatase
LVLGPFFFWSYGLANHHAASLPAVPSVVFDWEAGVPFLPWTILPYWSIDLFYGLSLLLAPSRATLFTQAARLLTAQCVCVASFLLWPLRFATPRPAADGWAQALFDALSGFDLPYNQAPSLHIVLLLVLWDFYRRLLPARWLPALHAWSALIGVSVLTTYQHHAIDVPTGLAAGALCLWLWPWQGQRPWQAWRQEPVRPSLALAWGLAAAACGLAAGLGGAQHRAAWLLAWPALAFALVALAYLGLGTHAFQKRTHGRPSLAARWLLWPHRLTAWLNARAWTRRLPASVPIHGNVWLGRLPLPWEPDHRRAQAILDLSAELHVAHPGVHAHPMLDLVAPASASLQAAADQLERLHRATPGPVLVGCALGFSRSVAVLLVWLCRHGHVPHLDAALQQVRQQRPQVVLPPALLHAVQTALGPTP